MPDLLETTRISEASKSGWRMVSKFMWNWLLEHDYEFRDAEGNTVSPRSHKVASASSGRAVKCGHFSRVWVRLAFHDCGTYSKLLRKYGCNGSVRKELPLSEPWLDYAQLNPDGKSFKVLSNDVFDQFKVNGVMDPAVDVAFDDKHPENAGMAAAIAGLYKAKMFANTEAGLWDASFADVLILGSLLGMARCEGPHVRFVPGRLDSDTADPDDLLPNFQDDFFHTMMYFLNNGLTELDGLALIAGSHSTACFSAGCLDPTPNKLDKKWAEQVLNWDGQNPPLCNGNSTTTTLCMAPSDVLWLRYPQTKRYLQLLLSNVTTVEALSAEVARVLDRQGVVSYQGVSPSANLCLDTNRACPSLAENFAYHNLVATSMFRLTQLKGGP